MERLGADLIGLVATAILVATLAGQTMKQWREGATRGIARWFFLGQVSASICFVVYSLLIHSRLFAVANTLVLLSALAGYVVLRLNRRRALRLHPPQPQPQQATARPADAGAEHHLRVVVLG